MNESTIDALGGAIAGIFTNLITHPFDTIKCRMQSDPGFYNNIYKTVLHIYKNEKFSGFYKGIMANTLLNVPVASFTFFVFGKSQRYLKEKKITSSKHIIYLLSGCTAGMSTLLFVVPLELIKCNQQINFQGKTKKENRFLKKAHHIYRKKGAFGFSRGFCVTLNRDVLSTGLYFSIYYTFKDYYKKKHFEFNSFQKGIAGAFAGLVCWVITYPFDTAKTIIQTASFKLKQPKQYELFKELYKERGIAGLYRGASPSLIYSVGSSALMFIFFEISKNLLLHYKPNIN